MSNQDKALKKLLHEFGEQYDMPFKYMTNDRPPAHQLVEARAALVEQYVEKLGKVHR